MRYSSNKSSNSGKSSKSGSSNLPVAKSRWNWLRSLGLLLAVLGTCLAIRLIDAPGSAIAQTTRTSRHARDRSDDPPRTVPKPTKPTTAAVVNSQEISRADLSRECIRRYGVKVLESEVNKRLILQACKVQGVQITNDDIESEIARMANKFGLPTGRWLAMLKDERDISAFQYRRDIVWPTLALRRLAEDSLKVSKDELRIAFESEYGPTVQTRLISTKSKAKAEKLHAKVNSSPDLFGRLAKDYSEDENSAAARGLIPPIRKHVGEIEVVNAAFALKQDEISPVIHAAGQYLILKCERHLPSRDLEPEQRNQVLAEMRDTIADKKLRSAANVMFKKLQGEAEIINVLNDPEKRKRYPGVAAIINGTKVTLEELGEQCILRHGKDVLASEINRRLLVQVLKKRSLQVKQEDIKIEIERAAESFGFLNKDGSIDVDGWLAHITGESGSDVDIYIRDAVWPSIALKKIVHSTVKVSEEDLKKGFLANYGERVDVLAIVLSSQRTAHEVFDLARANSTDKFFGELANQYSIEPLSRANLGQVPPIRQHGGQPMLEKEAFSLKPGEVSGVIATGDKFVILRCLGRTKPVVEDMSVVRDELTSDIREKKLRVAMAEEFDRIKESAQIDNFLEGTVQTGSRQMAKRARKQIPVRPVSNRR